MENPLADLNSKLIETNNKLIETNNKLIEVEGENITLKQAIHLFCSDCPLNGKTECHSCYLHEYKD